MAGKGVVVAGTRREALDALRQQMVEARFGAAGERVRAGIGDTGMIASDLLPSLPQSMRELRDNGARSGVKI